MPDEGVGVGESDAGGGRVQPLERLGDAGEELDRAHVHLVVWVLAFRRAETMVPAEPATIRKA